MRKIIDKIIPLSLFFLLVLFLGINVQAQQGNGKGRNKGKIQKIEKYQDTSKSNCVNSCNFGRGKSNSGCFVDKDGDGINDNKCSGMGIGRHKKHGEIIRNDTNSNNSNPGRRHRNRGKK